MNLQTALNTIADTYHLDADQLRAYADEDTIGGYHSDPAQARWTVGSIWGVEGQILYALIRATLPKMMVNLGCLHGCSMAHMAAAVKAAQREDKLYKPTIVGVDLNTPSKVPVGVEFVGMDCLDYVEQHMPPRKVDFLFEDFMHGITNTKRVWSAFQDKAKKGALIVSHDATHYLVGKDVQLGIEASGVTDALKLAVEPSDCGLAVWRKP